MKSAPNNKKSTFSDSKSDGTDQEAEAEEVANSRITKLAGPFKRSFKFGANNVFFFFL